MNKNTIVYILLIFLVLIVVDITREVRSEEYIIAQVDIGKDMRLTGGYEWVGELPIEFTVAYYNVNKSGWYFTGGFSHQSNVLSGPPFNDDLENVLDKVYIGFGKRFNLR